MIGKNETIVAGEPPAMNWIIDSNRSFSCVDLNRRIIDASMTLTDYRNRSGGEIKEFDVIEFSDREYSISTIRVKNNKVEKYEPINWKRVGTIGQFFGCPQSGSSIQRPTTTPTIAGQTQITGGTGPHGRPEITISGTERPVETPEMTTRGTKGSTQPTESKPGFPIFWIILVLLLILAVIGFIAWFLIPRGGAAPEPTPPPAASASTPAPAPVPAPESSPGPTVDSPNATPTPMPAKTIRSNESLTIS